MKLEHRWALLVLTLATTAMYFPALIGGVFFLDVYLTEVHPHHVAIGQALLEGRVPFWTPDILLGYPLASNPQVGAFYPIHLLMALFMEADRVLVWSAWLHTLAAAFSTYALARKCDVSAAGAVTAGLVYACSPFLLFYHQAIHGLAVLALMPAVLLVTWIAAERGQLKIWAAGALLIALQMFAGHLQFVGYTLAAAFGVAVFAVEHPDRRSAAKAGGMCVVQSVVAGLIYAPQLIAAFQLWRHSLRKNLSAADVSAAMHIETLSLDDLVELVMPRFFGGPSFQDFWYPEFLGVAAVIAVAAAFAGKRARGVNVFAGLMAVGLAYLVLLHIPGVDRVLVSLPGVSAFRAPGRILCWMILAAAILAGAGVDNLFQSAARQIIPWVPVGVTIAALCLGLVVSAGALDGIS